MSVDLGRLRHRHGTTLVATAVFFGLALVGAVFPDTVVGELTTTGTFERALRLSTPITLAAIGGLYAEKSGVFNIGLEGFLIFGAFFAGAAAFLVSGGGQISQLDLWISVLAAVVSTAALAALFAVLTIRYKANQIVAGLAVWFIGLGFGPFGAIVLWGQVNSPPLQSINEVVVPGLSEIPFFGPLLFAASPLVMLTLVIVVAAYVVLEYTRFGYWIQAAGENPQALDTAGIGVNRVRYAAVVLSGALCGLGGASLTIAFSAGFVGRGVTMVNGRGWIAITAYLFGNYNPLGTFGASLLFGGVNALQIQLQTVGISIPNRLAGLFPFFAVLVVLTLVGRTRMPSAVGKAYETEEEER
jgi:simple sugar transport system permease protein